MKKIWILASVCMPLLLSAQRQLNYVPTADGYIMSHNGNNNYTRALYGGNSLFRIETSDRPIFAAYHKRDNRNINFTITCNGTTMRLDSIADCRAYYKGGERRYILTDPAWRGGSLTITALATFDSEGCIWKIEGKNMPDNTVLTANCCETVKVKISRSGDIGVDPKNCFAPDDSKLPLESCPITISGKAPVIYVGYSDRHITATDQERLAADFDNALSRRDSLVSRIVIATPDPYINTLGSTLVAAGDGIWDGTTWQHGAVGWRMPLSGWRGAYTGDYLGWHDRAKTHFDAYAASQVTDVEPVIPHPAQDSTLRLARAEKRWGTPMYSNGYICRNPHRDNQMHHYDMNLCYIDELMRHFAWTGDTAYAREKWNLIKSHLAWEKRNFDPDNDGLYDAYCCIWASDALYYSGGGVTHSSAYNYYANKAAATIAEKIGEDPTPYAEEADRILRALDSTLWMDDTGVWAEYRESLGNRRLHDHPAVWTIYHAIDSEAADPFQKYSATRYIDDNIPHIPVTAHGLPDGEYSVISTTDWLPYAWSINNVAFAELFHTSLAYWQAGRADRGFNLLKSAILDGMYLGSSPGNIGQISYYDAARGECYRDFADPVGILSRAVIEGLFGFSPDAMNGRVDIRPGFPADWNHASISHPDFSLSFKRDGLTDSYRLSLVNDRLRHATFTIPATYGTVESVTINGKNVGWRLNQESVGMPFIMIDADTAGEIDLVVTWKGSGISAENALPTGKTHGHFREYAFGDMKWWMESQSREVLPVGDYGIAMFNTPHSQYVPVNLERHYNASITDIFHNEYLSPRPATTTLQIPVNGIGEWCHPLDSANIDDSGLRKIAARNGGVFTTPQGIPFRCNPAGDNVAYTSLWDNYPDSVTVPVSGHADAIALMLVGSTNHMQCHIDNALITATYKDGSSDSLHLRNPYNWCPVEQDFYTDRYAFNVSGNRPLRYTLKDGLVSDNLGELLGIEGVYGRRIDGGAGVILCMPLDGAKELKSLTLTTLSNDIVAGLVAATCIINPDKSEAGDK